eukprot:760456-Hanusia_phi.AAC.1
MEAGQHGSVVCWRRGGVCSAEETHVECECSTTCRSGSLQGKAEKRSSTTVLSHAGMDAVRSWPGDWVTVTGGRNLARHTDSLSALPPRLSLPLPLPRWTAEGVDNAQ